MYGFAQEALVIFPKYDVIVNSENYRLKANFATAVSRVCAFLRSRGMTPMAFITDDLARYYDSVKFEWVSTLSPGDLYFMSRNCDMAGNVMSLNARTYPDVYEKSEAKYPYPEGADIETRFDLMCKRDQKSAKAIIPQFKVVVHFYYRGAVNYTVASKPGDGRIRLVIDVKNFMCTPYLGGQTEDAIDLIGASYANRSVLHWEV